MKLATQLWTSLALLSGVLLLSCALALVYLDRVSDSLESLVSHDQPSLAATYEMELEALEILASVQAYARTGAVQHAATARRDTAEFNVALARYVGLRRTPAGRALAAGIRSANEEFQNTANQILERRQGGQTITQLESPMESLFVRHRRLDTLLKQSIRRISTSSVRRASQELQTTVDAVQGMMALMLIAGLTIAAFTAYRVRRSIVVPIRVLVSGARELEKGQLGHRVHISEKNELSELAHGLNTMAGTLEREKAFLSAVVDNIDAGIVACDAEGNLSFFNRATETLHGLPSKRLPPEEWADHYDLRNPDGTPMAQEEIPLMRACRGERIENVEMIVAPKGRDPRTLLASGRALLSSSGERLGAVVAMTDITDRKNREAELAEAAARDAVRREAEAGRRRMTFLADASELLASSMNYEKTLARLTRLCVPFLADWCAIDILDAEGDLRRVAVAHSQPDRERLANELHEKYPPDRDAPRGVWAVVRSGAPQIFYEIAEADLASAAADAAHLELMRSLGLRSAMILPLQASGRTIGALTIVTSESGRTFSSTEVELATDLVHRASGAVERALLFGELENANRLKDDFLATLSHELRTPLTAILGWSRMLSTVELDEGETAEAIATIERSAVAQSQLIEDVLDVSRITSGKMVLQLEPVNLASIIQNAVATVRPAADSREIRIDETLVNDVEPFALDPDRMQQVLWNLLNNAVKFSPKGSCVEVSLRCEGSDALIQVRDDGVGISPSFLPHVFEPFRQADSSTRRSQAGLGLGLAIVRRLVELHGGSVSVASEGEGRGSTFTILLPIKASRRSMAGPDGSGRPDPSHRPSGLSSSVLRGASALVLDDVSEARALVAKVLEHAGARVSAAESVDAALAQLATEVPDFIVSDIALPIRDGYDFIREIRSSPDPRVSRIPVLALTAQGRELDRGTILNAGFDEYVRKPVDPARLVEAVRVLLDRETSS